MAGQRRPGEAVEDVERLRHEKGAMLKGEPGMAPFGASITADAHMSPKGGKVVTSLEPEIVAEGGRPVSTMRGDANMPYGASFGSQGGRRGSPGVVGQDPSVTIHGGRSDSPGVALHEPVVAVHGGSPVLSARVDKTGSPGIYAAHSPTVSVHGAKKGGPAVEGQGPVVSVHTAHSAAPNVTTQSAPSVAVHGAKTGGSASPANTSPAVTVHASKGGPTNEKVKGLRRSASGSSTSSSSSDSSSSTSGSSEDNVDRVERSAHADKDKMTRVSCPTIKAYNIAA